MSYHVDRVGVEELGFAKLLDDLQQKNKKALGFLPHVAQVEAIARGRVLRCSENGEPCGWMIHGKLRPETRILQCVVQEDARRVQHARALVDALKLLCNAQAGEMLSLHCAEDLESNAFWAAVGFTRNGRRLKNSQRERWQNRYEMLLPGHALKAITAKKALKEAGKTRLHSLLCKGDAKIATLNFCRDRAKNHTISIPGIE